MSGRSRVRELAGRAYLALPDRLRETVLPWPQGYRAGDVPAPLVIEGEGRRVLIGVQNTAGQAGEWARAVDALDGWTARSVGVPSFAGGFGYAADLVVPPEVFARSRRWGRAQFGALAAGGTDVVVAESLRPLFGRAFAGDTVREVRALQTAGVTCAVMWHGSDIRSPRRHVEDERWSPFRAQDAFVTTLQRQVDEATRRADDLALPEFVSTPDLLRDRPAATWTPVVVDTATWRRLPWEPAARLRVLHAPSSGRLKGTDLVIDALQALDADGTIELVLARGVSNEQMRRLVASCDVVVDQFVIGTYGVAACEAMAAGRIVVSHVAPDVRAAAAAAAGEDLPIVEVSADTVAETLRDIARRPGHFAPLADAGRRIVERLHDGRFSAAVLTAALGPDLPAIAGPVVGESSDPDVIGPE